MRRADLLGVLAAQEDAAVGVVARPEFHVDHEVLVRRLADQMGGALAGHFVGDDGAVLDPPVGFADLIPVAEVLAVEQLVQPSPVWLARVDGSSMVAMAKANSPAIRVSMDGRFKLVSSRSKNDGVSWFCCVVFW